MTIHRAQHWGMCFGVRDAIALARAEINRGPLTVFGDLVHNSVVIEDLQRRGVLTERRLDAVATERVMITAHGTSERTLETLRARGHQVLEATCPLVHHAHRALAELVRDGCHPVVIGQRNHVEVLGMTGNYDAFDVVLTEDDVERLLPRARFGIVSQTTQPQNRVQYLVGLIRKRFPASEVITRDTVCRPTRERQSAAEELAQRSDVVVVVGGMHSNNTQELASTCARWCPRIHRVQGPTDIDPGWFRETDRVGLTAGTSTPDEVCRAVEDRLEVVASALRAENERQGGSPAAFLPTDRGFHRSSSVSTQEVCGVMAGKH